MVLSGFVELVLRSADRESTDVSFDALVFECDDVMFMPWIAYWCCWLQVLMSYLHLLPSLYVMLSYTHPFRTYDLKRLSAVRDMEGRNI